jgi:hypothetical protein
MSVDRYNELFIDTLHNNFKFNEEDISAEIVLLNSGGISCRENKENTLCCRCEKSVFNTYTLSFNCNHIYHRNCLLRQIITDKITECQLCRDSKNKTCSICQEQVDYNEKKECTKCKNIFHKKCSMELPELDQYESCHMCKINSICERDNNEIIDTIWGPTNIQNYASEA